MKQIFKLFLLTAAGVFIGHSLVAQSISLANCSFGIIETNEGVCIGSGFVVGNTRTLLTCAHVIENREGFYFESKYNAPDKSSTSIKRKVNVTHVFPDFDLALLECDTNLCYTYLTPDTVLDLKTSQKITYIGFDTRESVSNKSLAITFGASTITTVSKRIVRDTTVEFILFHADVVEGFSGGPILNDNGQVIALMQGWLGKNPDGSYRDIKGYYIRPIFEYLKSDH